MHTDMGIRFPLLVAEVKGLSLNGSLVSAQNQAAISGASMTTILRDLAFQATVHSASEDALCFSIVTAGPLHELWVHFSLNSAHHMECLRSLHTTHKRDALEFASCLFHILSWSRGAFKDDIVSKLDRL
jgi:hypothetical protein